MFVTLGGLVVFCSGLFTTGRSAFFPRHRSPCPTAHAHKNGVVNVHPTSLQTQVQAAGISAQMGGRGFIFLWSAWVEAGGRPASAEHLLIWWSVCPWGAVIGKGLRDRPSVSLLSSPRWWGHFTGVQCILAASGRRKCHCLEGLCVVSWCAVSGRLRCVSQCSNNGWGR